MEGILVHGVTEVLMKPLISLISQQIHMAWGVKDDLRKLKETLESIQSLISDAERKQVNDSAVRLWLRRLKDVIYDVDDVMDEFSYGAMRPREHRLQAIVSSSNPLVFRFKMARKIRAINERLDEIFENSERFRFQNIGTAQENQNMEIIKKRNRLTSSNVDDSLILGRDGEKSDIINLLIEKPSPSVPSSSSSEISTQQQNVSTLSIVGMGGLGKTTVAQIVYKDDLIVRNFERRAWVCVSDTFDIYKILRDIIESITGKKGRDPSNVDVLANQVKEHLLGKKYLLVLDDVWHEDVGDWDKLKSFLVCGGLGSKILVTTRSQNVASAAGGTDYSLNKLPVDVCWSIIRKKALSQDGAVLTKKMTDIGTAIARKCDGLPLVANSLGSLMRSRIDESYWRSIVDDVDRLRGTSEHKKVISILKLSYDKLSPPLKQCFSYSCIFPKDWEINREMLIRLWIAEGFLLSSSGGENTSLEDIGNEYFEYLVWSSFFQVVEKYEEWGDIETYKMHDLVHDLATSVLDRNEFRIAKVRDEKEDVSEVRRLQLQFDEGQSLASPSVLPNAVKLRTIVALNPENISHINSFFQCRGLRILCPLAGWDKCSLSSCSMSSISKLKHLRYLDLSNMDLSHEVSLNHSYNLQTLILRKCRNVPSCLLHKIGSLKSLRHLDISYSEIKSIPENIGSLEHLSCLDLSNTEISKLPDSVTCITSLSTLKFRHCHNLDGLPRELGALTRLSCLDLSYTSIKVLPGSCTSNLCNLEVVRLGYECEFPKEIENWPKLRIFTHHISDGVMPRGIERLTYIEILMDYNVRKENEICGSPNNTSGIEELAGLNSLQVLGIRNLENVNGGKEGAERGKLKDKQHLRKLDLSWGSTGDDEELGNSRSVTDSRVLEGLQPHSNLKKLLINGFSGVKLPKRMMGNSLSNCLPNLAGLNLYDLDYCEQLPALGMLPFLRVLHIQRMKSIKCLGEEFYYQREEESSSGSNITNISSSLFPSLVELRIKLENLEEWVAPPVAASCFSLLKTLEIVDCNRLRTTPQMNSFSSLEILELDGTHDNAVNALFNRRGGEECLTSLTSICINFSPGLVYLPPLGVLLQHNTSFLQRLHIKNCRNLQGFRDDADLNNNNNLNHLHSLRLYKCPVLTSLPDLRLCNCLRSLKLEDCSGLTSLPDLRLCTSLRELTIFKCKKLNKESIPYDLKKSLTFLEELKVDFIQRDEGGRDVHYVFQLTNLVDKKK